MADNLIKKIYKTIMYVPIVFITLFSMFLFHLFSMFLDLEKYCEIKIRYKITIIHNDNKINTYYPEMFFFIKEEEKEEFLNGNKKICDKILKRIEDEGSFTFYKKDNKNVIYIHNVKSLSIKFLESVSISKN